MAGYFFRRALLMIPTFLGITVASFVLMQLVPGGPVERELMLFRASSTQEGAVAGVEIPQEAMEEMRRFYGFDKPIYVRYALWLRNLLHFDLGRSYVYQDPVWDIIRTRLRISLFLGLSGFVLSYLICVPLGVWKAVRHGSKFDLASSVIVLCGYSVPGWALGTGILVLVAAGAFGNLFPLGGFRPSDWGSLDLLQKVIEQIRYMLLPTLCYATAQFALLTILTKNALMENLHQDYVRTAFAKGLSEKRVIFVHALRNSWIPIVASMGRVLTVLLAGAFLIEKVFNIDGMGYLGYTSVLQRDYPVALGIVVISSLILMTGNIVSDLIYAIIDPRIRFR